MVPPAARPLSSRSRCRRSSRSRPRDVLAGDLITRYGMGTTLAVAAVVTVAWAAIVAVGGSRVLGAEARPMIALAERGRPAAETGTAADAGGAQRRVALALDERNRQIAELAASIRAAPITEDATAVARSMVRAARTVTGDPTWTLAVLRSDDDALLALGVYGMDDATGPEPIGEVHRWASTIDPPDDPALGAQLATGPWGAFVTAEVAAADALRAILVAPWEGRAAPSRAERELLSLLGQHAGAPSSTPCCTSRCAARTAELNRMASVQADFLRGVSHDLQTPLTTIRALAAELRAAPGLERRCTCRPRHDRPPGRSPAAHGRRSCWSPRASRRGRFTPRSEVFRVEPLIERTWARAAPRPAVHVARPMVPGTSTVGDPDRFEQVLWALLDNAMKYSPAGSRDRRHRRPDRRVAAGGHGAPTTAAGWTPRRSAAPSTSSIAPPTRATRRRTGAASASTPRAGSSVRWAARSRSPRRWGPGPPSRCSSPPSRPPTTPHQQARPERGVRRYGVGTTGRAAGCKVPGKVHFVGCEALESHTEPSAQ